MTPARPRPPLLLAVDGDALAHRAYHAYQRTRRTAPDGHPLWALHGTLLMLALLADRYRPAGLLVGLDDRQSSTRRSIYPAYKIGRPPKPRELADQLTRLPRLLDQLGIPTLTPPGGEADDVLGSAAAAATTAGWRCLLVTSDRAAYALLSPTVYLLRLRPGGLDEAETASPQTLAARYGITPDQYTDWAALVGDRADNLPGVPGIGPKTATCVLTALAPLGGLDAARTDPDAAAERLGAPLTAAITSGWETITRNRTVMAVRRDLPVDLARCRPRTAPPAAVEAVLGTWHLQELTDRVTAALHTLTAHEDVSPPRPPLAPAGADIPPPPLTPTDPRPVCPTCGRAATTAMPLADTVSGALRLTGETVLVDRAHPAGDLVAVYADGVWAVRRIRIGEAGIPAAHRRRSHYCPTYAHRCAASQCAAPARLYAAGPRCDTHRPAARWQ